MPADDDIRDSEEAPKKGKSKLLIIIILMVLLLGGGFAALYFLILKQDPPVQEVMGDPMENGLPMQAPRPTNLEPGPIETYPPFLVNLADPGGNRYLKVTISLELSKEKNFPNEVTSKEPKIKDIIITILSSKTYDEISTTQGKIALKQEILRRLNTIMSGGRVTDVYITEFVVQ